MRFYGEIQRVDEEQRMVWGYASTEKRALDGLVITRGAMEGALDDYMEYANVREMHQPSAVGTTETAHVDDTGLYVGVHVVDDTAWKKVVERVYKAFSIGCKITERDATDRTMVTGISLREISLVDRPSDPGAKFDCYRAADFQEGELDDEEDLERREFTEAQRKKMAQTGEAMPDGSFPIANRADLENAIRAYGRAKNKRAVKRHILRRAKALGAMDLIPEDWKSDMTKRAAEAETDENPAVEAPEGVERSDAPAEGSAPAQDAPQGAEAASEEAPEAERAAEGGEEPAADAEESAERAAEGAEEPAEASEGAAAAETDVERTIREAREAADGLKARIEAPAEGGEAVERVLPGAEIRRGLYSVARVGSLLAELAYITSDAQFESDIEGDNSPVPGKLRAAVLELARAYKAMSDEELAELLNGINVEVQLENGVIMLCAASGGLERDGVELSEGQVELVQRGIDALVARGFKLPAHAEAEPAAEVEELRRRVDQADADKEVLMRAVSDLTTQMKEITERVAPAKTAGPAVVRVVGKGEDAAGSSESSVERSADTLSDEEVQRHLDSLPPLERADLLVRAALARPVPLAEIRSPRIAKQ